MDLRDSPDQAHFRARLRSWLADNLHEQVEPTLLADRWPYMLAFQKSLYQNGWVALSYPTDVGGQGLGPVEEAILSEELGKAGAPTLIPLGHLGRPVLTFGTAEQKARYLPALLSSEEIWCQGFSEPEAGSDLASLRTRAVPRGDEWELTGHKIWTSYGAFADFCLLLARTDMSVSRHHGISAFIVPLDSPGVTVRPIVLANGEEEFAEVYLDGVRVPDASMLGDPGDGWRVAMEVVNYERGAVETGYLPKFERYLTELGAVVKQRRESPDRATLLALGEVAGLLGVLRMHCLRRLSDRAAGIPPGPESSVDKLLMTQVEQRLMDLGLEVLKDTAEPGRAEWFGRYLYGRAGSIYGGSSQIQRNIIAQRELQLPRET